MDKKETEELFIETFEKLDEFEQITEKAIEDIMGVLERPVDLEVKDALQLKWKLVDLTECRSY